MVNTYITRGPDAPPTVVSALPDEFVVITVTVGDGRFNTSDVRFPEDTTAVLRVRNTDRADYQLRFFQNLTEDLLVRAGTTTSVEFTTPRPGLYEGLLLSPLGTHRFDALPIAIDPRTAALPDQAASARTGTV